MRADIADGFKSILPCCGHSLAQPLREEVQYGAAWPCPWRALYYRLRHLDESLVEGLRIRRHWDEAVFKDKGCDPVSIEPVSDGVTFALDRQAHETAAGRDDHRRAGGLGRIGQER